MAKKRVEFGRECLIFEVCQPQQAKKVLEENMSISTVLPSRISLYEERGKTILATLKPTALLTLFNVPPTGRGSAGCRGNHHQNYERRCDRRIANGGSWLK